MNIREALGLAPKKKIRYGFIALGDIAQEAMLPGVEHTGNSSIAALMTGDPVKAGRLAERYGVAHTYSYEQLAEMLASGHIDAIYVATPNWRHSEFVLPALAAGIHVLVEKPLEIDSARCQKILDAQKSSKAKLMVAYRLHFEPATIAAIERVRNGELGEATPIYIDLRPDGGSGKSSGKDRGCRPCTRYGPVSGECGTQSVWRGADRGVGVRIAACELGSGRF